MTGSRCQDLIEGNHNQFETQGSLRVDVSASVVAVSAITASFLRDYRKVSRRLPQVSVKRVNALLQFVPIFQTSVEPFQIGTVPQFIRFFGDGDPDRTPGVVPAGRFLIRGRTIVPEIPLPAGG